MLFPLHLSEEWFVLDDFGSLHLDPESDFWIEDASTRFVEVVTAGGALRLATNALRITIRKVTAILACAMRLAMNARESRFEWGNCDVSFKSRLNGASLTFSWLQVSWLQYIWFHPSPYRILQLESYGLLLEWWSTDGCFVIWLYWYWEADDRGLDHVDDIAASCRRRWWCRRAAGLMLCVRFPDPTDCGPGPSFWASTPWTSAIGPGVCSGHFIIKGLSAGLFFGPV